MLLYIFWHWPKADIDLPTYEADEAIFQRAVRDARSAGLLSNAFARSSGSPWANAGGPAYEDLYLLENSAALDPLNDAAVQEVCKAPHDRLARAMLAGTGGLYSLSRGQASTVPAGDALWFRRLPGVTYDTFYDQIAPALTAPGACLWRRQMVLSPAPEFCAFGLADTEPFAGVEVTTVHRQTLWSSENTE